MFAIVAATAIALGQRAAYEEALAEYLTLRAQQPGDRGALQVAVSEERDLLLALWGSASQSRSAHAAALTPASERLLRPLMAGPLTVLGAGEVVLDSLTPGAAFAVVTAAVLTIPWSAARAPVEESVALVAQQPGARGELIVAVGDERYLALGFWASEAHDQAARPVLLAEGARLLAPLLAASGQRLGAGAVVRDTISGRAG